MVPNEEMLSVVIPVYCSEKGLPILTSRLICVLQSLGPNYEVIFVDDGSTDDSWRVLLALKEQYGTPVRIIRLLRNGGQHNAILCGFVHAQGDIIITMDDDLQNPPEEIPKLVQAIHDGFDLAIGAYDSKKHSKIRNLSGELIDELQRRIYHIPNDFQLTSFRAIRKRVVEHVCQMGGAFPYITCMLFANASSYINVPVRHDCRIVGNSNYTFRRSIKLAANLMLGYSQYPLYFVALCCLVAFIFCLCFSIFVLVKTIVSGSPVPGWASTVMIITTFSAINLGALVIALLYITRINQQITQTRRNYAIAEIRE